MDIWRQLDRFHKKTNQIGYHSRFLIKTPSIHFLVLTEYFFSVYYEVQNYYRGVIRWCNFHLDISIMLMQENIYVLSWQYLLFFSSLTKMTTTVGNQKPWSWLCLMCFFPGQWEILLIVHLWKPLGEKPSSLPFSQFY